MKPLTLRIAPGALAILAEYAARGVKEEAKFMRAVRSLDAMEFLVTQARTDLHVRQLMRKVEHV